MSPSPFISSVRLLCLFTLGITSLFSAAGCTCGRGHRIHLPKWKFWERRTVQNPVLVPSAPAYRQYDSIPSTPHHSEVTPAPDPSISSEPHFSPAEPHLDGIRVPAPLPSLDEDPAPQPETVKPQEKLPAPPSLPDQARMPGRSSNTFNTDPRKFTQVRPAPTPITSTPVEDSSAVPRLAERQQFNRQPVGLDHPELDVDDFDVPESRVPSPIRLDAPADEEDLDFAPSPLTLPPPPSELEEEELFDDVEEPVRPSSGTPASVLPQPIPSLGESTSFNPHRHRPTPSIPPRPIPSLDDVEQTESLYQPTSHSVTTPHLAQTTQLPDSAHKPGLQIRSFRFTKDSRVGRDEVVVAADDVRCGQNLVIQVLLEGVHQVAYHGHYVSRVSYHFEIRDAEDRVVTRTQREFKYEAQPMVKSTRSLSQWITIPSDLKPGSYALRINLQDDNAKLASVKTLLFTAH